jgi:hypothetical protein
MDDLNDAFDRFADRMQPPEKPSPTRVSRDVTASHYGIAAGRDVYLGPPPRRPHAVRRWLDRWLIAPAATGAGVTMAIFFVWCAWDANAALETGYTVPQLLFSPAGTTPGHEAFSTSLAIGGPIGLVAGWAWAFLKA